jgi:type II secretory ATPase GspE/PulE/Tfp pilus assembly ATPase PilB-like protein/CheY-like chemotaxis protein
MSDRPIRDEWLLPTLEHLIAPEAMEKLRSAVQDSYWEAAVRRNIVSDEQILGALATRFRMKIADLTMVSQQSRDIVPEGLARKYRILPIAVSDSVLDIATADPYDLDCERTLAFATGRTVRMSLAAPTKLTERIDEVYRPENAVEKILEGVTSNYDIQELGDAVDDGELDLSAGKATERPVIRLVDHILAEGITSRASDIHLEPEETGFAVRYRIDGVLRQAMTLPRAAGLPLISRIKIMASMDIADRLRPQDGRARVAVNGVRIDLRVSTLPASQGEKVVIRILDSRSTVLTLDSLGLGPDELSRVQQLLGSREGIVLVTGPTGSGKTTTLYSILRQIQNKGVNIVTVEDPVEYRLQGIVQVQVNEKAGLTFAAALRSILRQDPDVVLIGEIRDRETAMIAIQASLTGHLVFSTLHTNDAASSVTRLVDIGIESYKIAAALKGVVAQRLLRKLCLKCRVETKEPVAERLQRWLPAGIALNKAVGCADCAQTGYRGRLAITEVLSTSTEVERRISSAESTERISEAARDAGMKLLWEAGMNHVRAGITSVEELMRVVEIPSDAPAPLPQRPRTPASVPEVSPRATPRDVQVTRAPAPAREAPRSTPVAAPAFSEAFQLVDEVEAAARQAGKGTVLLVEDEAPLRRVLRDLLERDGYMVVEAQDGVQALDEIDRAAPDVVVLDLNLPRLDGYGVLTHLRSRPKTVDLPVIVLTAKGDEDSEVRVFEYGANDFLTKPFRPRALSARLKSMIKPRA